MKSKVREKKENGKGGNRYSAKKEKDGWDMHFTTHGVFS